MGCSLELMGPKPVQPITFDHHLFEPGTSLKMGKDGCPVCFDCNLTGHVRRDCPGTDCSWVEQQQKTVEKSGPEQAGWEVEAWVNGERKRALIDMGCGKTLV